MHRSAAFPHQHLRAAMVLLPTCVCMKTLGMDSSKGGKELLATSSLGGQGRGENSIVTASSSRSIAE